jgi:predicted amidohydrolase
MSQLKVTTIQSDILWEDPAGNRARLDELLSDVDESTDLLVLPEMFTTGFTMNPDRIAEPYDEGRAETIRWMSLWAEKLGAALTGSVSMEDAGRYVNRMLWVTSEGCEAHYDKRHLFTFANEDENYSAGQKRCIVEYKGWKICLMVCYDLRFPVWSRNTLATGSPDYDILVYVANWPSARVQAWKKLLLARAIENQSFVVASNRIGKDAMEIDYSGGAAVIDPKGDYLYESSTGEEVVLSILDKEMLEQFRTKFPNLKDADRFNLI